MIHSNLPYPVTHFSVYLHNQLNKNRKDFYKDFFFNLKSEAIERERKTMNEVFYLSAYSPNGLTAKAVEVWQLALTLVPIRQHNALH